MKSGIIGVKTFHFSHLFLYIFKYYSNNIQILTFILLMNVTFLLNFFVDFFVDFHLNNKENIHYFLKYSSNIFKFIQIFECLEIGNFHI